MVKDYNTRRNRAYGASVVGTVIMLSGINYSKIISVSQPPLVVERYEVAEKKLLAPLKDLTLANIKSRSAELIPRANQLEAESSEIESYPTFAQVIERYKHESNDMIGYYALGGGFGVMLFGLFGLVSSARRRETSNGNRKDDKGSPVVSSD